jgi:hypothetical protein
MDSLRNRHKEARNLLVSYRHRTTLFNLFFKDRNRTTITVDNVAESDGTEGGRLLATGQNMNHLLGSPLGSTHYIRWVHGLVGGDKDELTNLIFDGYLGNRLGA